MERELVKEFAEAEADKKRLEAELSEANKRIQIAKMKLIEYLESHEATETRKYEGLGQCSLGNPKLRARFLKENEERVFEYVRSMGREDILKFNIHHSSFSMFVKEMMDFGHSLPNEIEIYMEPVIKFKGE